MKNFSKSIINAFKAYILRDQQILQARHWLKINGDHTLRLDYPLTENSVVFDLGGYRGDFAAAIIEKYNCHVYIFEPMPVFAEICAKRFANNSKVFVLPFGLSSSSGKFLLSTDADGSSLVRANVKDKLISVQVTAFTDYMKQTNLNSVDLMKINIEGGEYDLLPHIINEGWIGRVEHLQIQFHNFVEQYQEKRNTIRSQLTATHSETWCYPFVWESWSTSNQMDSPRFMDGS